jgi:PhzF family phenazine biosynthesis protein
MKIKQYQIDAFASRVFEGNPAAVCPLDCWLADDVMQAIAAENNVSETAFFVPSEKGFALRWFAPQKEVNLCGHATLATAHVLYELLSYSNPAIIFETRSGELVVEKRGKMLSMDFPVSRAAPCQIPDSLIRGLGHKPVAVLAAEDYMVVYDTEEIIHAINPDQMLLTQLDLRGVCITAPGNKVDFVSRFFAPKYGIPEDPVTGSSHCMLAPYWAGKLGKKSLTARQISRRGGDVQCELKGERVLLSGTAVTFMTAEIEI